MVKNIKYLLPLFLLFALPASGQQFPGYPVSYRIFSPAVLNPAITGSRDISEVSFTSNINGTHNAQILNGSTRLLKSKKNRWPAPDVTPFSNVGTGGYLFHEETDSLNNFGFAASLSYHFPVSPDRLSFLALGVTAKGMLGYPLKDPEDTLSAGTGENIFTPDMDAGIYFYSARFFAGVSVTNVLTNPDNPDFPSKLSGILSRQYFFTTGYKIILSRKKALLLEPSLLMNFGNSEADKNMLHYHPAVKLYYRSSYIGWYLNETGDLSFMMHLRLPWFYVSSYVEFPKKGDIIWYNGNLDLELSVGIILGRKYTETKDIKYW